MLGLMFFGIISYSMMGVSQLPDIDSPVLAITVTWEGAAPEVMETDVVDIIEDSIMSVQGIKEVSSSIRQGVASITLEFELERDIDAAMQEVKAKIDQAQRQLPNDIDPPIIMKTNPDDQPIVWLTFSSGTMPTRDLMAYVQDHVKDRFTSIAGVGDVFLGGYIDPNLRIWVDQNKLDENQLSVRDVVSAVQNQHEEVPAGRIETKDQEFNVRVMGEAASPAEFENLLIAQRAGAPIYKPIYIKDVAHVEDGLADIRRIMRSNGKAAVGLGIRKQRGSNEVATAHRVLKRLAEVQKTIPSSITAQVRFNRTKFSEDSMNELMFTLLLSAIATSLVCWLFLGSWSATLNILLAIPTSILGTFLVIRFLGFTLNTFTVLGLSLAIGIVVDDAIMVLENIVRFREKGAGKVEGAREGARQITFAALAATLALIAIFLPVAFMSGIVGRFFYQFGMTITIAVALSLLEALTLTPMRCSQFLQVGERHFWLGKKVDSAFRILSSKYQGLLRLVLRHRGKTVILAIVVFVSSLGLAKFLRFELVPPQDQSMFLCRMRAPEGSSIDFTDARMKQAEAFVASRQEVSGYMAIIGGFSGGDVNTGVLFVTLKNPKDRPMDPAQKRRLSQGDLMKLFRVELNKIPDIKANIQDLSLSGFSAQRGYPIEFSIRGPEWEKLADYSSQIKSKMEKTGLMIDVDTDYQVAVPEIRIIPDRANADARGVDVDTIGSTINSLIGGERIAKYTKDGRRYDVRVRMQTSQRSKVEDFNRLWVWNNRGEQVPLREIVKIEQKLTPLSITRKNRERAISIFANMAPGASQAKVLKEINTIAKQVLPEGYHVVFSGSAQAFQESTVSLLFVFWLGVIVAYMVLASQFNNYFHPVSVLMAMPFSISGALLALWICRQSLNIYSMIGIILLMGLVKKNSILLVDFTNQMRALGQPTMQALQNACPIRLRPILMTSLANIVASVPPALALGPGAETRIPMAITIIGGVAVSTLLTLLVVPCVYSYLAQIRWGSNTVEPIPVETKNNTLSS